MPEFDSKLVECGPSPAENASRIIATGSNWLFQIDSRFHDVLSVHNEVAVARVQRYLEKLKLDSPQGVIRAVRLQLNDYLQKLGIGLMSLGIEPIGRESTHQRKDRTLLLPDESGPPTLGLTPEALVKEFGARIVKFAQTEGGEEVEALTNLWARGYLEGEVGTTEHAIAPFKKGTIVTVPPNSAIGLRMGVPLVQLLSSRGFFSTEIIHDDWSKPEDGAEEKVGQMYWCRKLKLKAA